MRQDCKSAGRCPTVMDVCKNVFPPGIIVDDVLVKCHLYEQPVDEVTVS